MQQNCRYILFKILLESEHEPTIFQMHVTFRMIKSLQPRALQRNIRFFFFSEIWFLDEVKFKSGSAFNILFNSNICLLFSTNTLNIRNKLSGIKVNKVKVNPTWSLYNLYRLSADFSNTRFKEIKKKSSKTG